MTATQTIRHLSDVIRIQQLPWQWWGALLENHERGLLLVISDWLEEQGDELQARAWREIHKGGYEPVRETHYEWWWFRKNMPAGSYPATKLSHYPNYQRAMLDDDLFYAVLSLEYAGNIRNSLAVPPYVCMTRDAGRAGAFHKIAHAQALLLAGFKPQIAGE